MLISASNPTLNQKAVKGQQFEYGELVTHLANVKKTENFIVQCGIGDDPNNYQIDIYSFPLKHLEAQEGPRAIIERFLSPVMYNWQKTMIVPAKNLLTTKTKAALTKILTKMANFRYTYNDPNEITLT